MLTYQSPETLILQLESFRDALLANYRETHDTTPATRQQAAQLASIMQDMGLRNRDDRLWVLHLMIGDAYQSITGYSYLSSTKDLTYEMAKYFIQILKKGDDDDCYKASTDARNLASAILDAHPRG